MVAERSMGWGDQEEAGLTGLESGYNSIPEKQTTQAKSGKRPKQTFL